MADEFKPRKVVEQRILHYLLKHPAAADSAEGVRHWWIGGAGEANPAMVRDILEDLLKRGWLITHGEAPGTRIYAFNEREREAVLRFAGEPEEGPNG